MVRARGKASISSRCAAARAPTPARLVPRPRAAHTPRRRPRPRAPPRCARGPPPPASPTRAPPRPRPRPWPRAWPRPAAPAARRCARTRLGPARRLPPPLRLALPSRRMGAPPLRALLAPRAHALHRARLRRAAQRAPRWSLAGAAARRRWRQALAAPRGRLSARWKPQELPARLRPQLAPPLAAPQRRCCPPLPSSREHARLAWRLGAAAVGQDWCAPRRRLTGRRLTWRPGAAAARLARLVRRAPPRPARRPRGSAAGRARSGSRVAPPRGARAPRRPAAAVGSVPAARARARVRARLRQAARPASARTRLTCQRNPSTACVLQNRCRPPQKNGGPLPPGSSECPDGPGELAGHPTCRDRPG